MSTAPLTFANVSLILLRRKRLLLGWGVIGAAMGLVLSVTLPETHTAIGSLIVENGEPNVPELGMGIGTASGNPEGVVLTQVEILRSYGLIKTVVNDLALATAPDLRAVCHWPKYLNDAWGWLEPVLKWVPNWHSDDTQNASADDSPNSLTDKTAEYVRKQMRVDATEHSSVINVQFSAGSPALAAAIVNDLMKAYFDTDMQRRAAQIEQVNAWLTQRSADLEKEAIAADRAVQLYVASHHVIEVQGSSADALLYNTQQLRLADAKQALARQQSLLDTLTARGTASDEVLNSKTIEMYKEREAKLTEQAAGLGPLDPRGASLQQARGSILEQIIAEKAQIALAIKRNVTVAQSDVAELEAALQTGQQREKLSAVDTATLSNLRAVAQAKRQLFVAFGSRSEQSRLAAAQLPSARTLHRAVALPHHSTTPLGTAIGFLSGALLVGGLVLVRDALRNRVISADQVMSVTGLPMLGSLPELDLRRQSPPTAVTETMRAMWWNALSNDSRGVVVTITSSETGEGKTTLTLMLSRRIAADGGRVLVIDGDLRRRGLATALGQKPRLPLEAVLRGGTLRDLVERDPSGIDYILADGSAQNPMFVLQSAPFRLLLADARGAYDAVFLDTPPVLRVADAVFLGKLSDHIVFVVGAGLMANDLVADAVERFAADDRQKIVTVLTRVPRGDLQTKDYFKGYGSVA
jgi:polysaccharide biosynthesis transport protein